MDLVKTHGDQAPLDAAWILMRRALAPMIKRTLKGVPWNANSHADCIDVVLDALLSQGLTISQPSIEAPDGMAGIATRISHAASGAWRESYAYGKVEPGRGQSWMQAYGSTLSYLRKYEVQGVCFFAGEADHDAADKRTYADKLPTETVNRESFEQRLLRIHSVPELATWATAINDSTLGAADREILGHAYAAKLQDINGEAS